MQGTEESNEAFEAALDSLLAAFDNLVAQRKLIVGRARLIRRQLDRGRPMSEIAVGEEQPLIVQIVRDASAGLIEAFARFQRAEAVVLHHEGVSMERIGALFGISRQRVAALLRPGPGA